MTPFKKGDVVIRTWSSCWWLEHWSSYIIHSDDPSSTSWNGSVRVFIKWKVSEDTFDRDYFKLDTSAPKAPFKVWDVVQYKAKSVFTKTWVIHSFIEDWMRFYFEDKNKNKSVFPYKTCDFELVAEVKDANSNNDGCITTVSDIKAGDYVRRVGDSYQEVREWYLYKVYEVDKDNDLYLIIDWQPSTYCYRSHLFVKALEVWDIMSYWTCCAPTLIVGDARSVGATGDSNSNPVTLMSKTFNDYAVEAFMSNEENRTAATNAQHTLFNLIESLEQAISAIEKVKTVINRDSRRLNEAMNDSNITVISALVAENPAVKEYVERFMENTVAQLVPEPVVSSTSISDKFK